MKCLKTGLRFQVDPMSATYHGDLYHCQDLDCLLIRGIAPGCSESEPHIIIRSIVDAYRILNMSEEFDAWNYEWNPGVVLTTMKVIVADSRF